MQVLSHAAGTDPAAMADPSFDIEAQARWLDRVEALPAPIPESENGHE